MNSQLQISNKTNRKIAQICEMNFDGLNLLFWGTLIIPVAHMLLLVNFNRRVIDLEALPEPYGFLCILVWFCLMFGSLIMFFLFFPKVARLFSIDVQQVTLHENGIVVLPSKEKSKFFSFEELNKISVKQSENDISLSFSKGKSTWVFSFQKKNSKKKFLRVVQLAAELSRRQTQVPEKASHDVV